MAGGGADIRVEGADTLARTAHAAAKDLADLTGANREVADSWASAARGAAPRRTGRLAASTTAQATKNTAEVGSVLIYAGPIHSGWRAHNISPQPWIGDTLDSRQGQVISSYEQHVQNTIDKIREHDMAGKPKRKSALRAPLLEIEYTDGREELISTTGLDVLSYEKYAKQEKWPNLADDKAGNHYLYYVGYAHLKRTGELNGVRFDAWADTVASLTDLNNEEPEEKSAEEPDPTEPTPSLPAPTTG